MTDIALSLDDELGNELASLGNELMHSLSQTVHKENNIRLSSTGNMTTAANTSAGTSDNEVNTVNGQQTVPNSIPATTSTTPLIGGAQQQNGPPLQEVPQGPQAPQQQQQHMNGMTYASNVTTVTTTHPQQLQQQQPQQYSMVMPTAQQQVQQPVQTQMQPQPNYPGQHPADPYQQQHQQYHHQDPNVQLHTPQQQQHTMVTMDQHGQVTAQHTPVTQMDPNGQQQIVHYTTDPNQQMVQHPQQQHAGQLPPVPQQMPPQQPGQQTMYTPMQQQQPMHHMGNYMMSPQYGTYEMAPHQQYQEYHGQVGQYASNMSGKMGPKGSHSTGKGGFGGKSNTHSGTFGYNGVHGGFKGQKYGAGKGLTRGLNGSNASGYGTLKGQQHLDHYHAGQYINNSMSMTSSRYMDHHAMKSNMSMAAHKANFGYHGVGGKGGMSIKGGSFQGAPHHLGGGGGPGNNFGKMMQNGVKAGLMGPGGAKKHNMATGPTHSMGPAGRDMFNDQSVESLVNSFEFRASAMNNPSLQTCSKPLRDFRLHAKKTEIRDIVPHIVEFAKDQFGSRLIQLKLLTASADEKQLLYVGIRKEVDNLVLDPFGNYVIQKFFEYGTLSQRRGLAQELHGNVLALSFHMFGCWVMQRAIDFLEGPGNDEQLLLSKELEGEVLRLVSNQNGNHVVQICIQKMPSEQIGFILDAFKGEVKKMARHTYGCRVIQRLIEHCMAPQLGPLIAELVDDVEDLAKDEYGNYVIQSIAERIDTPHRAMVLQSICDKILPLSTDKYASNVCEKALVFSSEEDRILLMNTILGDPLDDNPPLYTMMRDRYANYIIQKMIGLADNEIKLRVGERLKDQICNLKKFTYGRHIVHALARTGIVDKSVLDDMSMIPPTAPTM